MAHQWREEGRATGTRAAAEILRRGEMRRGGAGSRRIWWLLGGAWPAEVGGWGDAAAGRRGRQCRGKGLVAVG